MTNSIEKIAFCWINESSSNLPPTRVTQTHHGCRAPGPHEIFSIEAGQRSMDVLCERCEQRKLFLCWLDLRTISTGLSLSESVISGPWNSFSLGKSPPAPGMPLWEKCFVLCSWRAAFLVSWKFSTGSNEKATKIEKRECISGFQPRNDQHFRAPSAQSGY